MMRFRLAFPLAGGFSFSTFSTLAVPVDVFYSVDSDW